MDLQVDIYECGSKHIHVILRGQAEGIAAFGNFEMFVKFIKTCQEFIDGQTQVPQAFLAAFNQESPK
jgi:hypothetical protein